MPQPRLPRPLDRAAAGPERHGSQDRQDHRSGRQGGGDGEAGGQGGREDDAPVAAAGADPGEGEAGEHCGDGHGEGHRVERLAVHQQGACRGRKGRGRQQCGAPESEAPRHEGAGRDAEQGGERAEQPVRRHRLEIGHRVDHGAEPLREEEVRRVVDVAAGEPARREADRSEVGVVAGGQGGPAVVADPAGPLLDELLAVRRAAVGVGAVVDLERRVEVGVLVHHRHGVTVGGRPQHPDGDHDERERHDGTDEPGLPGHCAPPVKRCLRGAPATPCTVCRG